VSTKDEGRRTEDELWPFVFGLSSFVMRHQSSPASRSPSCRIACTLSPCIVSQ